jgi:hypothetical protein
MRKYDTPLGWAIEDRWFAYHSEPVSCACVIEDDHWHLRAYRHCKVCFGYGQPPIPFCDVGVGIMPGHELVSG